MKYTMIKKNKQTMIQWTWYGINLISLARGSTVDYPGEIEILFWYKEN